MTSYGWHPFSRAGLSLHLRPQRRVRVASELDFELLTIDGSGGGTGMSLINHKITEKEKRDNLGRRGIYFWQECNFVAEYVIEKEWGAPPF